MLLGIDIGTTGTKAAVFNLRGELQSMGSAEYEVSIPAPDQAEQDPEDWWEATCKSVKMALKDLPRGDEHIKGISVSSQAPTLLPLDSRGRPLGPAIIWMDRRAGKEMETLVDEMGGGTIERLTGNRPDPFYVAPKLLWYRMHQPELFDRTSIFIQANGYINYRLTGRYSMDNAHAALLQLREYPAGEWSETLCGSCGIDPGLFPAVSQGHEIIGEVTDDAARMTGLKAGTPVMAGTVDSAAAGLEAGAVGEGKVAEMTGTSTVLIMPNASGIKEPSFIYMPHAVPGQDLLLAALVSSGASLKWYRDRFGAREVEEAENLDISAYDVLTRLASGSAPGSNGVVFLPYMMGERSPIWHTNARGTFFGISLSTTRGDMIRAILEGTAYALRHNIEVAANAGMRVAELRSVGGGAKSSLWNQIKADVLGIPVVTPEAAIGAPFGDAILAGAGTGYYPDIETSVTGMVKIRDRYEPDPGNHGRYNEYYHIYRNVYDRLRDEFDHLAEIRDAEGRSAH